MKVKSLQRLTIVTYRFSQLLTHIVWNRIPSF